MNVLLIDDEPIIHQSLNKTFRREGFQVDSAFSAKEGLKQLGKASYDLVIADLMMPDMDGLEFLAEFQKARYTMPAIMITGYPTIRTALLALRLGAKDYIPQTIYKKRAPLAGAPGPAKEGKCRCKRRYL